MMRVAYKELRAEFQRVLLKMSFPADRADICATIPADNNRDGVYSHGLSRFPVFIDMVAKVLKNT